MIVQSMPYPASAAVLPPIPEGLGSGTLMIPIGSGGAWDSGGVREIGNVLHDPTDTGKEYKMCYTGYLGAHTDQDEYVGAAYSSDGITWTKQTVSAALVARKSEDPYLIKVAGTYYMYVEDKNDVPFRNIRLFTSTDFVSWTDQGDVLDKGASGEWDADDVSSAVVWVDGSTWHMLFEGRNNGLSQAGAIGHATSSDGISWTKGVGNPIMVPTNAAWNYAGVSWAEGIVPDELKFESDGLLILYFHGFNGSSWVPGVAVGRDIYSFEDVLGSELSPAAGDGDLMPLPMFDPPQYAYPVPATGIYRAAATTPANAAPSFSVNPVISQADGFVGVGDTLTCTEGTSTGFAPGYQWKRGGVAISDATDATYILDAADLGEMITCTVTVVTSGGRKSATSNSLGPVVTPSFATVTRTISAGGNRTLSDLTDRTISNRTA